MSTNSLSKEELIASGWSERQIDAALDEPDGVGPAGHWLNTSGKPYYHPDRVAVAAYRIGLTDQKPEPTIWNAWIAGEKPTAMPLMTFDFYRIAEACIPGSSREIRTLRISHPVMGRLPGTRDQEMEAVGNILKAMVTKVHGAEMAKQSSLDGLLHNIATGAVSELGEPWPQGVIARKARRSSYVSKAVGLSTMFKFLNAIALIQSGQVRPPDGKEFHAPSWLVWAPKMRFDLAANHHIKS
jgi:hypothetical protein